MENIINDKDEDFEEFEYIDNEDRKTKAFERICSLQKLVKKEASLRENCKSKNFQNI